MLNAVFVGYHASPAAKDPILDTSCSTHSGFSSLVAAYLILVIEQEEETPGIQHARAPVG